MAGGPTGSGRAPASQTAWLRPVLPVAACVLLVSAVAHVRVPLLPAIGDDLSLSATQLGVAVTLFGLGRLALDLPAGRLADRFRPVRMMGARPSPWRWAARASPAPRESCS